jgi:hypothetical protein
MRHSFTAIVWLLLLAPLCAAQANLYSPWPNFPQSTSFFPTFDANGHNYQPKIYLITTGGPSPPTGLAAVVQ